MELVIPCCRFIFRHIVQRFLPFPFSSSSSSSYLFFISDISLSPHNAAAAAAAVFFTPFAMSALSFYVSPTESFNTFLHLSYLFTFFHSYNFYQAANQMKFLLQSGKLRTSVRGFEFYRVFKKIFLRSSKVMRFQVT